MSALKAQITHEDVVYDAEVATINSTRLGREDHGWFQAVLDVDLGCGGSTGIGGHSLDTRPGMGSGGRRPTAYGLIMITEMINIVVGHYGAWEDLPGKRFFALYSPDNSGRGGWDCVGMADLKGDRVLIFDQLFERWGES